LEVLKVIQRKMKMLRTIWVFLKSERLSERTYTLDSTSTSIFNVEVVI
jgi:hypothetical protein